MIEIQISLQLYATDYGKNKIVRFITKPLMPKRTSYKLKKNRERMKLNDGYVVVSNPKSKKNNRRSCLREISYIHSQLFIVFNSEGRREMGAVQ